MSSYASFDKDLALIEPKTAVNPEKIFSSLADSTGVSAHSLPEAFHNASGIFCAIATIIRYAPDVLNLKPTVQDILGFLRNVEVVSKIAVELKKAVTRLSEDPKLKFQAARLKASYTYVLQWNSLPGSYQGAALIFLQRINLNYVNSKNAEIA